MLGHGAGTCPSLQGPSGRGFPWGSSGFGRDNSIIREVVGWDAGCKTRQNSSPGQAAPSPDQSTAARRSCAAPACAPCLSGRQPLGQGTRPHGKTGAQYNFQEGGNPIFSCEISHCYRLTANPTWHPQWCHESHGKHTFQLHQGGRRHSPPQGAGPGLSTHRGPRGVVRDLPVDRGWGARGHGLRLPGGLAAAPGEQVTQGDETPGWMGSLRIRSGLAGS